MSEQNPKHRIDPTAAGAAGRELIDTALQHNPVIAIATALLVPVLSLFRRRGRPTAASVEKMKLESYSYRPVASAGSAEPANRPRMAQEGHKRVTRGSEQGATTANEPRADAFGGRSPRHPFQPAAVAVKGGMRHG